MDKKQIEKIGKEKIFESIDNRVCPVCNGALENTWEWFFAEPKQEDCNTNMWFECTECGEFYNTMFELKIVDIIDDEEE